MSYALRLRQDAFSHQSIPFPRLVEAWVVGVHQLIPLGERIGLAVLLDELEDFAGDFPLGPDCLAGSPLGLMPAQPLLFELVRQLSPPLAIRSRPLRNLLWPSIRRHRGSGH